jgi:hypothetical protein
MPATAPAAAHILDHAVDGGNGVRDAEVRRGLSGGRSERRETERAGRGDSESEFPHFGVLLVLGLPIRRQGDADERDDHRPDKVNRP